MRAAIVAADSRSAEGVKWNSPSFHTDDAHFATVHLRNADRGGWCGSGLRLRSHDRQLIA
jgi:hypothetical protein